jgi:hypothetical protein
VPLCPSQTPHRLIRARTRASTMRCQRLTAWAMAWTTDSYSHNKIPCFHLTLFFITSFQNYTIRTVHTFIHYFSKIHFNIKLLYIRRWSRGSSVSIVSGYGLDDRAIEVRSPAGANDFSSSPCIQTGSGAHPASYTVGTWGPFSGGKARQGRDADHSPPSSAEV